MTPTKTPKRVTRLTDKQRKAKATNLLREGARKRAEQERKR